MKEDKFKELLILLGSCKKCTYLKNKNGKDNSLINIYKDQLFCQKIPSIWTDWLNRINSSIMVIGQDWGPYCDMKKLYDLYQLNPTKSNWQHLIDQEKSHTKKLLDYYIKSSSNNKYGLDDLFITNAIMCARKGNAYRRDNINLKKSTLNCSSFLTKQIEIVNPKVILTLGYYPLLSLSKIYNFKIEKNLKETITKTPEIVLSNFIIIPLYHPVSQIKKEEQLNQYLRIWKHIS